MTAHGSVFLVGFMGSGKTSVGRELARLLGMEFVDLDERIAIRSGRSVQVLFAEEGEAWFREREREALLGIESLLAAGAVIATGGGTFIDPGLRAWMLERGRVVWLDATLDAIERRIPRDGTRPLFGDRPALERMHAQRRPAYAEAPMRFDTSETDVATTALAIRDAL
ncbi:MAG: shikimate kinase [Candidatus Eisenbacteria bacterium]